MNKPNPPIDSAILESAAEWFVEFNAEEATSGMRAEFDAWLRRSPEHVRAYLSMLPAWEDGGLQSNVSGADLEALTAQARQADNVVVLPKQRPQQPNLPVRRFSRVAVAAGVVIACLGFGAVWLAATAS